MNPLDILFGQVANAVQQHSREDTPGPQYDANPVLNALSNVFQQQAQSSGQSFNGYDPQAQYQNHAESDGPNLGGLLGGLLGGGAAGGILGGLLGGGNNNQASQDAANNIRPSSEDPYGDPSAQAQSDAANNIRPSSEDPYGDPSDSDAANNIKPSSEDPYGDPSDG